MTPYIFNLYLEHKIRVELSGLSVLDFNYDAEAKVDGRRFKTLRFAVDIVLVTKKETTWNRSSLSWINHGKDAN